MAISAKCYNWCFQSNGLKILNGSFRKQFLRSKSSLAIENLEDETFEPDRENEVQLKQNKSRLSPIHQKLLRGEMPYPEPVHWSHETVKYKKKMYALYGSSTNINPGLMWPTKEQLAEIKEYENMAYPDTLQTMMDIVQKKREEELSKRKEREDTVLKKLENLEMWKKELKFKQDKRLREIEAEKKKRERLVEEVRQHFGFTVDPRDERFQEMLAKKEKEERKKTKEARKKEKEKKMAERLAAMASSKENQSEQ